MMADAGTTVHDVLVAALETALRSCDPPVEVHPGVFAGNNLAEILAGALSELAGRQGGVEMLVRHRPGCWEADHVRGLAGPDWIRE